MSAPSVSARSLVTVAILGLVLSLFAAVPSASAVPAPAASGASVAAAETRTADRSGWTPPRGVIFNSPVGPPRNKFKIRNRINKAINHARPGSRIRVMSWNIMSQNHVDALLRAQRRGVVVRVIMDRVNMEQQDNRAFPRLRNGFRRYNRENNLQSGRKSIATLCTDSCRGRGGAAHGKFFLFTHTGAARRVVMHGGYNMTDAASHRQWNELFTFHSNRAVYRFMQVTFQQMWKDGIYQRQFRKKQFGGGTPNVIYFSPFRGPDFNGDPALGNLRRVKCKGARNTRHGRTVVRVAPDVMRHARGDRYADQFIRMHRQGCDIKIGYTVLGIDIHRKLRNAGVPMRHLVQDANGDKVFDRYFHLKVITVRGHVNNRRNANIVINGSANLSGVATVSDEHTSIMRGHSKLTLRYQKHITWWYNNFPKHARVQPQYRGVQVDPYQNMEMD